MVTEEQNLEFMERWMVIAQRMDLQLVGWSYDYSAQLSDKEGKHTIRLEGYGRYAVLPHLEMLLK